MENNNSNDIFQQFVEFYKSLDGDKKFLLSREFNKLTGGTLSQYNSPNSVAVAIVPVIKDGNIGLLGLKRNIQPAKGRVAFPGGFVEENEDLLSAAIRELYEETGVELTDKTKWTFQSNSMTPRNENLVFYKYSEPLEWDFVIEQLNKASTINETQSLDFIDQSVTLGFPLHQEQSLNVLNQLQEIQQLNTTTKSKFKLKP